MFISVDLPAPFSPRSACTSPRRTSNDTSSLATTPGNSLRMPRISRTSSSLTEVDAIARRREGEIESPSRRDRRCGYLLIVDGGLSEPAMICDLYWFMVLIHDCGTVGLILP